MQLAKKILIVSTLLLYIVHLIFNGVANVKGELFPNTTREISRKYSLPITPSGATFSIWGFIFTYQLLWLIYCLTTVFRKGAAANILSARFFVLFILNFSMLVTWLFVWSRSNIVAGLVVLILAQIFLEAAIVVSTLDLNQFLLSNSVERSGKADIWCLRLLVQNGLVFCATWTSIATLINTAVVIAFKIGSSTQTASLIVLSILLAALVAWFVLENFVIEKYVRFIFTEYVVIIVASAGILVRNWSAHPVTSRFVLAILIMSAIFLFARLGLIFLREKRRHVKGKMYGMPKA